MQNSVLHPSETARKGSIDLERAQGASKSIYDQAVLTDRPTLYLPLSNNEPWEFDFANTGRKGAYHNTSGSVMPNGDQVAVFSGRNSYFEFPDAPDLSVSNTGILTFEAWLRPDALRFPKQEGSGYVHWMGKGELPGEMEWAARMYGSNNREDRDNRISGYAFNEEGGRGIGSYFQDRIKPGDWIHYVFVINTTPNNQKDPGYTKIYRDGSNANQNPGRATKKPWDDMDKLSEHWPNNHTLHVITPEEGDAPLRVGTRDFRSFFKGAIGKVALYDYELSPDQVQRHYDAMWHGADFML
ncbi:hypothetical protein [Microvirga sp. P5_D2]